MPSIVSITSKYETSSGYLFGQQQNESEGAGSGIIVGKKDGYLLVVTNNHVIADAQSLSVGFTDGTSASGMIKGSDNEDVYKRQSFEWMTEICKIVSSDSTN